ncbi:efflux RND transporter periplasmic adaptor subunit [Methylobacterium oxalidis]|uniref:efflux RND transporter periplasmic adaptor subunit n=1 Tax=Methylobacterium oxalidis TaxID=944322 RepID=UPI0033161D4B
MRSWFAAAFGAVALVLHLGGGTVRSHDGHNHGDEANAVPAVTAPRGTSSTDALELVAVARGGVLTIFLDHRDTNEPVSDAVIQAETPEGAATAVPMPDGSYRLDARWSERPGEHEVLFNVAVGAASDIFPVTLVVAPPPAQEIRTGFAAWSAGLAVAHDFRQHIRQADPMPLLIGGGGFMLGIAVTLLLRARRFVPAVAILMLAVILLFGSPVLAQDGRNQRDAAPSTPMAAVGTQDLARRLPSGSVFVPKPTQRVLTVRTVVTTSDILSRSTELPGRIIPDPNGSGVVQSSVGGRISPPSSGLFPRLGTRVTKGEVLAYVTPPVQAVDMSDMRQRQGELDQQIAIVERRVERYKKLAPGGAVSQVQLDEAQAELKGLSDRRAALDGIRLQSEALTAPVSGVVAEANAVAGQMASPGAMVFQIVDPSRLWVEALSFDALASTQDATARMADGRMLTLKYQGAGLADRSQAVPMHFAVQGAPPELRTGQFITVLAVTNAQEKGLALPRASVVRGSNGQNIIYEHTKPEFFEPREVQVESLDAGRVLVVSGAGPGKRIVTQGAELLNQVR